MNFLPILILFFLIVALMMMCYFDVSSTKDGLKKGTAYEANPVMAWLQKQFPTLWPYMKAVATLLVALAIVVSLPMFWSVVALAFLNFIYYVVIQTNYSIASGG